MKIIVTGSLGNISQPLTKELIQRGHTVTVISSKPEKQAAIEALGATAAIGSVQDAGFLASAFAGAAAVYAMIPPNFAAPDMRAYYQEIGRSYAQAIGQAGVRRVVHLSSWGADLNHGTGIILGSHDVEGILNAVPGIALTHLRATSFYTNLYSFVGMIKGLGFMAANYGGDDKVAMVHPRDIATAAAEELATPATSQAVRYVSSDECTCTEAARILGAAIGQPELAWVTITDAQMQENLEKNGVPAPTAAGVVALYASIHSGALGQDYEQHKPLAMGSVKLRDFAQEFAAAF